MKIRIDPNRNSDGMRVACAQIGTPPAAPGMPPRACYIHALGVAATADEAARLAALEAVRALASQLEGSPAERATGMQFFRIEIESEVSRETPSSGS